MQILAIETEPFYLLSYSTGLGAGSPTAQLPFHRAFVDRLPNGLKAIIVTSDLQGLIRSDGTNLPLGLAVAEMLRSFQADVRLPGPDKTAVILAGDLHAGAGEDDVVPIWNAVATVARWVAGVAGNHDSFGGSVSPAVALAALNRSNTNLLDRSTVTFDGMRIGGLSGMIGQRAGGWVRTDADFTVALEALVQQNCDVLVLHDGPNVAGTELPGWPSIRRVIEAARRMLVIRGHDHWRIPMATLENGTQALNVESRVIVLQCHSAA